MKLAAVLTFFLSVTSLGAADNLLRYGLFVGANNGGPGRVLLKYASSDAAALASVMQEIGGMSPQESQKLLDPTPDQVLEALDRFQSRISQVHGEAKRVEFLFYYSGHSDEQGLLLGGRSLSWTQLRKALGDLNADVRMAVLDSCSSGAFTRLKGGTRAAPFLIDESTDLSGHAYLTSSSENEASQESDRIGGSFFTHYLISGLRGAADTTGDGRVTLNEVYQHAFAETLARTENTRAGPQHPSYDIQLSGTGDLVLTDINVQTSRLVLGRTLQGRVFVRNARGQLVAEVQKQAGDQVSLALGTGTYVVSIQNETQYATARPNLSNGAVAVLESRQFRSETQESNRVRGDEPEGPIPQGYEGGGDYTSQTSGTPVIPDIRITAGDKTVVISLPKLPTMPWLPFFNPEDPAENQLPGTLIEHPFNLGFVPGVELYPGFNKSVGISAHALVSQAAVVKGLQAAGLISLSGEVVGAQLAGLGSINTGSVRGYQSAGVFSITGDTVKGFQTAGIFNLGGKSLEGFQAAGVFNIAGTVKGFQAAGIFNASGDLSGVQIGLVNKSARMQGFQLGLVNIADHVDGWAFGLINIADNALYRYHLYRDSLGYTWNAYQWGVNGSFAAVSAGTPDQEFGETGDHLIRTLTMGKIWGDKLWFSTEGGVSLLPPRDNFDDPFNLGANGGWYPTVKVSGGVKLGFFQFYGGGGANLHIPGLSTPSRYNTASMVENSESGDLGWKPYFYWGLSMGF